MALANPALLKFPAHSVSYSTRLPSAFCSPHSPLHVPCRPVVRAQSVAYAADEVAHSPPAEHQPQLYQQAEAEDSALQPTNGHKLEGSIPHAPPPKQGDVVYGKVTHANAKGVRVKLIFHGDLEGYMTVDRNPTPYPLKIVKKENPRAQHQHQRSHHHQQQQRWPRQKTQQSAVAVLPVGHGRLFKVLAMPSDGRGPLLSAIDHDIDVLLYRLEQARQLAEESFEPLSAIVTGVRNNGLVCEVLGYGDAFMPYSLVTDQSLLPSPSDNGHLISRSSQDMQGQQASGSSRPAQQQQQQHSPVVGRVIQVGIKEIAVRDMRQAPKVVVSQRMADQQLGSSQRPSRLTRERDVLQLGNYVEGSVLEITPHGIWVELLALPGRWAFVHRTKISQLPTIPNAFKNDYTRFKDVFQVSERLVGLVSFVKDNNVDLRMRELEQEPGDMLNRERRAACFQAVDQYIVR